MILVTCDWENCASKEEMPAGGLPTGWANVLFTREVKGELDPMSKTVISLVGRAAKSAAVGDQIGDSIVKGMEGIELPPRHVHLKAVICPKCVAEHLHLSHVADGGMFRLMRKRETATIKALIEVMVCDSCGARQQTEPTQFQSVMQFGEVTPPSLRGAPFFSTAHVWPDGWASFSGGDYCPKCSARLRAVVAKHFQGEPG